MGNRTNREEELKYRMEDDSNRNQLLDSSCLEELQRSNYREVKHFDVYCDSATRVLLQSHLTLRVRRKGSTQWTIAFKGTGEGEGESLQDRLEVEIEVPELLLPHFVEIEADRLPHLGEILSYFPEEERSKIAGLSPKFRGGEPLQIVAILLQRREKWDLSRGHGSPLVELSFDRVQGHRPLDRHRFPKESTLSAPVVSFFEMEIETLDQSWDLPSMASCLEKEHKLIAARQSKALTVLAEIEALS